MRGSEGQETKNTAFVNDPDTLEILIKSGVSSDSCHRGTRKVRSMASSCGLKAEDLYFLRKKKMRQHVSMMIWRIPSDHDEGYACPRVAEEQQKMMSAECNWCLTSLVTSYQHVANPLLSRSQYLHL
jgi:hypothetical protein